jgi:hypothetical protein
MSVRELIHSLAISRMILRIAAPLVPRRERPEWVAEWNGELWHVWHSRSCGAPSSELTAFCLGAFQDAYWLRRNNPNSSLRRLFRSGSPAKCGLSLLVFALASMWVCFLVPGSRSVMLPSPYRDPGDLVMISHGGHSSEHLPTVRLEDYVSWETSTGHLFTQIAFYQPARKRIRIAPHRTAELSVARATDNLFEILNVPFRAAVPDQPLHAPNASLILTQSAWRRYFHSDPHLAGNTIEIGGLQAQVAGIISDDSWQLPGHVDAWILEDAKHLDELPSSTRGFVLARVKPSGFPVGSSVRRSMTVPREGGSADRYDCVSLAQRAHEPFALFFFTLLLACLALPATTPLPLGEYPLRPDRLPSAIRFRRWFFIVIKIVLILPLVFFSSLDLAYAGLPLDLPAAQYIQMIASFLGFLFALRWALQDQRRRCPVCLRLLTNPARVGQASRNFLAWNGTELMCSSGHGLLHIPEIPTSWFSTQRWLYLDSSWSSLFSDSYLAPAGFF